jgi:putative transposase
MKHYNVSQRKACELVDIAHSSYRYQAPDRDSELRKQLVELAQEKPRYGYRRLQVLLERAGQRVNHKRLFRVYRAAGLSMKRKRRKRLVRMGCPPANTTAVNQQWAIDFAQDRLASGRTFRIFSVVDTFPRQCLALEVDTSFSSGRITRVLERAIAEDGKPQSIRMDNGSEMTSRHFLAWGMEQKIELVHIQPGKPVQNAHVESFTGRLRDECLNLHWFLNVWDARKKIALWRTEYNEQRPHSSLGYRTPTEFRAALPFAPDQGEYRSAETLSRLPSGSLSRDLDNVSTARSESLI